MTTDLATRTGTDVAVPEPSEGLTIQQAFLAVQQGDMNAEKLAVMKDLLAMNAHQQFAQAFNALQKDMPILTATKVIPNRGKYLPFEDMMRLIGPLLAKHGFSVSFDQDWKDNRAIVTCHLMHVGGHSRPNSFAVRAGGKSDNETQSDCKAATTAKRNSLCQAINATIQQDCLNEEEDATIEGDPNAKIKASQADDFERRAQMLNCAPSFLSFARASRFSDIQASRHQELDQLLTRKERAGR